MKIIFMGIPRQVGGNSKIFSIDYGYIDEIAYNIVNINAHQCAYIGLNKTHPFSNIPEESIPLTVGGGITFKSFNVDRFPYSNLMWVGWDYNHFENFGENKRKKYTFKMIFTDVLNVIRQTKNYKEN